jgi:hypothetical protein
MAEKRRQWLWWWRVVAKTMVDERRQRRHTIGVKGKTRMGVASSRQTRGNSNRDDDGKGRWYTSDGGGWMTDWQADDGEQQDK